MSKDKETKKNERPPVVVVMGHVDHGKTTFLDYVRKSKVADREAGGITQAVGAYEIEHPSTHSKNSGQASSGQVKKITFIDTPGHEAFSAMRARGVMIADIAILMVAVDDGVKPQTKEAIALLKDTKTPFIVAFNKIDKTEDLNKVQNELAEQEVLLEGRGGDVSFQGISAKTGDGIPELLDHILLTAEVEGFTGDRAAKGEGFILESKKDNKRGVLATGIIKNGTVKVGDTIISGSASGKIKQLENFLGERIKEAHPSQPIVVLGFNELPKVGDSFSIGSEEKKEVSATAKGSDGIPTPEDAGEEKQTLSAKELKEKTIINVLVKADTSGALEAIKTAVQNIPLPEEAILRIVGEGVGDISDGDVSLAVATGASIVGFHVKITKGADTLSKAQRVKMFSEDVIYKLTEELEKELTVIKQDIVAGDLEILGVFGKPEAPNQQVIGGEVRIGEIRNKATFSITRGGKEIGKGKIINLQKEKEDITALTEGQQGGLLVESESTIKMSDHIITRPE